MFSANSLELISDQSTPTGLRMVLRARNTLAGVATTSAGRSQCLLSSIGRSNLLLTICGAVQSNHFTLLGIIIFQ